LPRSCASASAASIASGAAGRIGPRHDHGVGGAHLFQVSLGDHREAPGGAHLPADGAHRHLVRGLRPVEKICADRQIKGHDPVQGRIAIRCVVMANILSKYGNFAYRQVRAGEAR